MNVQEIKDHIENMPKHYQIEIGKLLIHQHKIAYNDNQNGIFINLSNISDEVITKLKNYIKYVDLQENQINQTEQEKNKLKDMYFK
jgi:hypothetical protein